jgi:hypothetical protein
MRVGGPSLKLKAILAGGCAAALLATTALVFARAPDAGPQSSAIPDFGAAGYGWFEVGDDFLPPRSGPGPVLSDPQHPYFSNQSGRQPTYRVADLSNPILRPWAVDRLRASNAIVLAGKVPYSPRERCWPAGVPAFEVYTRVRPVYFLQQRDKVLIINEGNAEVRHVYLNVPHSPNPKPSWYGESIGHYENGDTLVVDTVGLSDKTFVDNYLTPHTEQLHVAERFKITEGGKTLDVTVTVDDPGTFNTAWSARQVYHLEYQGLWDEAPCSDNNEVSPFGFDLAPIPTAERPDF